jgi:hypothetical protein
LHLAASLMRAGRTLVRPQVARRGVEPLSPVRETGSITGRPTGQPTSVPDGIRTRDLGRDRTASTPDCSTRTNVRASHKSAEPLTSRPFFTGFPAGGHANPFLGEIRTAHVARSPVLCYLRTVIVTGLYARTHGARSSNSSGGSRTHSMPGFEPSWSSRCLPSPASRDGRIRTGALLNPIQAD